jgi:hypothetical protein
VEKFKGLTKKGNKKGTPSTKEKIFKTTFSEAQIQKQKGEDP